MILINDVLAFQKYPMGAVLFCIAEVDPETNVVFRVTMNKASLMSCRTAVRSGTMRWASADGLLRVRSVADEVELLFRVPGQSRAWRIELEGRERERFLEAMQVMGRGAGRPGTISG